MIDKHRYVFILGAGASRSLNIPTGLELYDIIRVRFLNDFQSFAPAIYRTEPDLHRSIQRVSRFTHALGRCSEESIDRFLNLNKDFLKIGTMAIATAIYASEIRSLRPHKREVKSDDWYGHLFQAMISDLRSPDDLLRVHENRISFITFNYDRSLENFFFENLLGYVTNAGKSRDEVAEAILKIPILHIFGKVGYLPWERGNFENRAGLFDPAQAIVNFGDARLVPAEVGFSLHESIQLMWDERRASLAFTEARKHISDADRILFLGFGYAKENLELLGMPGALRGKEVYGTALGMNDREKYRVKSLLGEFANRSGPSLVNQKCKEFLREVFP